MPRLRAPALLTVIVLLGLALRAEAAPIVFDFEDGLQGWELSGSAQRVQTQLLGGEWAIFGDGLQDGPVFDFDRFPLISMETDLTEVVTISVDQFLLLDIRRSAVSLATVRRTDGVISGLSSRASVPFEQDANPGTWTFDVSDLVGLHEIGLWWPDVFCELPCTVDPAIDASFIDNITFQPIPEPTTLVLLGIGLGGMAALRRLSWRQ